jgi:inhibitor of cysteine peptidase
MSNTKKNRNYAFIFSMILIIATIGWSMIGLFSTEAYSYELSSFNSYETLYTFLKNQQTQYQAYYYPTDTTRQMTESTNSMNKLSGESSDMQGVSYSETNIQVLGVDEPDSVKTDGSFIYVLSNNQISIVKSYPVSESQVVSIISLDPDYQHTSFFVYNDMIIVLAQSYPNYGYFTEPHILEKESIDGSTENTDKDEMVTNNQTSSFPKPGYWNVSQVAVFIYNISNRNQPQLETSIQLDGTFVDARRMNSTVYLVASENTYDIYRTIEKTEYFKIPTITIDGRTKNISAQQIYYVDHPDEADRLTHVLTVNLTTFSYEEKSFLIGNTHTLYMSADYLYLTYTSYNYTTTFLETNSVDKTREKTKIHKIQLKNDEITYIASGEVPGRLLNQFSMDEHNTYFRIATTTGSLWNEQNPSQNHVFILDNDLSIVSSINNIAPGEELYAARFMGDRGYLVTFKNTDPFFTLDLSNPEDPTVLGELKLPGYSDYLHPYDTHHIIGIGKDTVASNDPNFAWYQGVKLALFNVSDINQPELIDTEIIGDRGSSTPVLLDHKALLFDKNNNLLVLPVSVYELSEKQKEIEEDSPNEYGTFRYQGAYIFTITTNGFTIQDRITHLNDSTIESLQNNSWYRMYENNFIYRSLYIENVLYTISDGMIQAHSLDTFDQLTEIYLS